MVSTFPCCPFCSATSLLPLWSDTYELKPDIVSSLSTPCHVLTASSLHSSPFQCVCLCVGVLLCVVGTLWVDYKFKDVSLLRLLVWGLYHSCLKKAFVSRHQSFQSLVSFCVFLRNHLLFITGTHDHMLVPQTQAFCPFLFLSHKLQFFFVNISSFTCY